MSDTEQQLPPNAAIDMPSDRDFLQSELVFWAAPVERVKFPYGRLTIQNQGADQFMWMSCTRQGICHINNAQNIIEADSQNRQPIFTDPRTLWEERTAERPSVQTLGDTLQSAMDQMLKKKLIAGYARLNTIDEMIEAIDRGAFIYTGAKDGDWAYVRDHKAFRNRTDGGGGGHAFAGGIDYDLEKRVLKAINSYGANNGIFDISFDLIGSLYSKYAIYDARDELAVQAFLALKKQKQLELTANSEFSDLLIQLRTSTGKLPIFNNYRDGHGITKELAEICVLRNILNSK